MENILEWSRRLLRTQKRNLKSLLNFLAVKYTHHGNEKIRVVFLVQYIPAWNKIEPVYRRLIKDSKFDTFLLCVPKEIIENELNSSVKSNGTYDYFFKRGYKGIIDAMSENGSWYNLKGLNPDYVFYSRPYNNYLPSAYTSEIVGSYTKICLVLYGIMLTKNGLRTAFNKAFCSNIYAYFADNSPAADLYKSQFPFQVKHKLQNIIITGAPALESIIDRKSEHAEAWSFSHNLFKIIWTPRWIIDPATGEGTNFFNYKDFLIDFAQANKDIDFLFRPHPLALDNFIRAGAMSAEEAVSFKNVCGRAKNISLDESEEYVATFWTSSMIISDISSLLPEYLVTGKPIIYCDTNINLELEDFARKMLEACYIAKSREDITAYIYEIKRGNDYLKEKRQQILSEIFGSDFYNASDKIVSFLLTDHAGSR